MHGLVMEIIKYRTQSLSLNSFFWRNLGLIKKVPDFETYELIFQNCITNYFAGIHLQKSAKERAVKSIDF